MPGAVSPAFDLTGLSREILDTMAAAITVIDAEGTIVYYNNHASIIGDRKPEYIGRHIGFCHNDQSNKLLDQYMSQLAAGRSDSLTWRIRRHDKELEITFRPLRKDGRLVGYLHTMYQVAQELDPVD